MKKFGMRICRRLSTTGRDYFDHVNKISTQHIDATKSIGKFSILVPDTFSISKAPNGGYLTAACIGAGLKMTPFPGALTVNTQFINKTLENVEAVIDVNVLQVSRSTATMEISISQEDKLRAKVLATFGDITKLRGINHNKLSPPSLPPREKCIRFDPTSFGFATNLQRIELLVPENDPFRQSVMSGRTGPEASLQGWIRFADGGPASVTPRSLAYFLDTAPPPVLCLTTSRWVPTLEYTVHFWDTAALEREGQAEWLRLRYSAPYVQNGVLYADGELWTEDGSLLATSRQLARVL